MSTPELEAIVDICAAPEDVFSVISDLSRMPQWSPQCRRMIVLGRVRRGTWTINVNRRGWKVWLTTARVVRFEPSREIAFRVHENRAIWSYELKAIDGGTRVTERRQLPNGTTGISDVFVRLIFGGADSLDAQLVDGMHESLAKIKAAVEEGSQRPGVPAR